MLTFWRLPRQVQFGFCLHPALEDGRCLSSYSSYLKERLRAFARGSADHAKQHRCDPVVCNLGHWGTQDFVDVLVWACFFFNLGMQLNSELFNAFSLVRWNPFARARHRRRCANTKVTKDHGGHVGSRIRSTKALISDVMWICNVWKI